MKNRARFEQNFVTHPAWEAATCIGGLELRDSSETLLAGAGEVFAAVEAFHLVVELAGELHAERGCLRHWQRLAEEQIDDLRLGHVDRLDAVDDGAIVELHRRLLDLQVNGVQRDFVRFLADLRSCASKTRAEFKFLS